MAPGDHTLPVTQDDRASLVGGEQPVRGAQPEDAARGIHHDSLHRSRARDLSGDRGTDGHTAGIVHALDEGDTVRVPHLVGGWC